jgi:hypothetical protein
MDCEWVGFSQVAYPRVKFYLPGANPTIESYNASVVNFYNATGSLASFEMKNIFFHFEKCSSLLQRWRCSCKFKYCRFGSRHKI